MQKEINIDGLGLVSYKESFWTGSKSLFINGVPATKTDKTHFSLNGQIITIFGNVFSGVNLLYNGKTYSITDKTLWYEYILALIPFIFDLIWGNSVELCKIFPVVGGATGGAICGILIVVNISLMKLTKKPLFKILIGLGVTLLTILLLYLTALLMLSVA